MNRPFTCTACGHPFQSWQNWHEHRAVIRAWEMHRHEGHTRRCLSPREWALMVLAEAMGIQEREAGYTVESTSACQDTIVNVLVTQECR